MQVDDRVRIVSDCVDKGKTGTIVKINDEGLYTHEVKLDDPMEIDALVRSVFGTDGIPYNVDELEVI